jgi:hypothetical protein
MRPLQKQSQTIRFCRRAYLELGVFAQAATELSDLTECELAMLSRLAVMKSMWSQTRIGLLARKTED